MPGPSANTIKTGEQPGDDIETPENDVEFVGSSNLSIDDNKNGDSHNSGNVEELQKGQGQIMQNYAETLQKEAQEAGLTKTQNVEEAFAAEVSSFFGTVEMDLKKGLEQDKLYEEKYAPKTRMAGMRTIIMDNKDGIDETNKALLEEHNSTMVAEYTKEEEIRNKFADELIEQEENEKLKRSRDSEKKKKKKQKKKEASGEIKAEEKKEETSSSSSEEETEDGGLKEPVIQTPDALTELESKLTEITFDQKMPSKAKKSPVQSNGPNGVDTEKKISHCQGSQGKNEAKRNQSIEKITGKNKKKDELSSKLTEIEEVSQVIDLPEEKAKNTDEYVAATLPTPEKKPAVQNVPAVPHQIGYRLTEPVNNWEEIVDGPAGPINDTKDDKKQEANTCELAPQSEKVIQATSETLTTAQQEPQEKDPEKVVVEVAPKATVQVKESPKVDIVATNKNQVIKSKNDEKINASPNKLYNQQQHYSDRGAAKVRHTPNKDYGRGRNLLPQQVAPRYQQPTQFQQPRNQAHIPQPPPQLPQPQFVQRPVAQPIKSIEQVKKEPAARKPTEFELTVNSYFVPEWQNIRQQKEELITELEEHAVSDQARALFSSLVKNQTRDTLDQLNVLKQSMKNNEFWNLVQKFLLTGTESNFCGIHAIACSEIIDIATKGDCTETCFISQIVSLITKENNSKMIEKALNQSTFTEKRNFMHYVCLTGNPCCITALAPIVSNHLLQSKDISGLTPVDYTVLRNELKIMQKMGAPVNFKIPRWYMENFPKEDWNSAGWEQVKGLELQMNVAMEGWLNLAATGVMNVGPAISNVVIGKYESGKKFRSQLHFHDQDFIIKNAVQPPNTPKKENILMSIVTFRYDPLTESEPSLVSISKPKGEEGATVPAQFIKTIKFVGQKVAMSKTYPLTYVSSNVSSLAPAIVSIVVPGESPFVDIEMSNHPADKDTLVAIQCFKVVYKLQSECSISTPPGLEPQMSPRHIVPVEMYPQVLPNQNFYQPQHYGQPMIPQLFHNNQPPPGPAYPNQLYQGPIQNHPNFIPPNLGMPPTMFNPIVSQPILGFPGYIPQQYGQHPAHPPHQMYPPPHPHQQYQRY